MREAEIDELIALDVMGAVSASDEPVAFAEGLVARLDEALCAVRDKLSGALSRLLLAEADLADAEALVALTEDGDEEVVREERHRRQRLMADIARERDRLAAITYHRTQARACIALLER